MTEDGMKRSCWVCFGTEQEDENDTVWICPCKCKGTMKWVHESCLQRWIDETQKRNHATLVSCNQCKTQYILSYPPANCLVKSIEEYDKFLFRTSPVVAVTAVIGSIYWCFRTHGQTSVILVMGYDEGWRIIEEADPLLRLIGLPTIPIVLILSKMFKWEDFILRIWKQKLFKLPKPLSYIIDEPPPHPRANCDQILVEPGFNDPMVATRMFCGALLLPTVSALIGRTFFSFLSGPHWRKSLLGGLSFLLIKGAMKIYLRKSNYIRYSQRSIKNYTPNTGSSDPNEGQSRGSTNVDYLYGPSSSSSHEDHFNDYIDANDDEELGTAILEMRIGIGPMSI